MALETAAGKPQLPVHSLLGAQEMHVFEFGPCLIAGRAKPGWFN